MAESQSTNPEYFIKVLGVLSVALILLYRVKELHRSEELDSAITLHIGKLRRVLRLLTQSLYPGCTAFDTLRGKEPPSRPKKRAPLKSVPAVCDLDIDSAWDSGSAMSQVNCHRCKALLIEVMKRAAHDWVLYRVSSKLDKKELALDAFIWLFKEEPGHTRWRMRNKRGPTITSFLAICEALDMEPDKVREHIRGLDAPTILNVGRPAEQRKRRKPRKPQDEVQTHEVSGVRLESLDQTDPSHSSYYEAYYATTTLGGA